MICGKSPTCSTPRAGDGDHKGGAVRPRPREEHEGGGAPRRREDGENIFCFTSTPRRWLLRSD
eukprot:1914090-Amphidinium_carterae.1